MDFYPLLFTNAIYSWNDRALFSMCFGLILLPITIYIDYRSRNSKVDYAYWLYIVSVLIFWGGLSALNSHNELGKFFYCLINIALLFIGALLDRRIFAIVGTIGILGYLCHLSFTIFADSLGFPIVMVGIGILIIFMAIFFTKMEARIKKVMQPYIPNFIQQKMRLDE